MQEKQHFNYEKIKELNEKNIYVKFNVRIYKFIYRLQTIEGSRVLRVSARNERESEYFIARAIEKGILKFKRSDLFFYEKQNCGKDRQLCLTEYLKYLELFGECPKEYEWC